MSVAFNEVTPLPPEVLYIMQRNMLITLLLLLLLRVEAMAQSTRLLSMRAEPVAVRPNLLSDPGFEEIGPSGFPVGWEWSRRNTDADCAVDETVAHSGRRSLRFTNGTPFGAHVYGMLWRSEPVRVQPGRPYTLSGWFRSADPGVAHLMGGAQWQFRVAAPVTGSAWRRVWLTFTPEEADRDFVVRLSTESPTRALWVDDLKLEEGAEPTPVELPSDPQAVGQLDSASPDLELPGDQAFEVSFLLALPRAMSLRAEASLSAARPLLRTALSLDRGAYRIVVSGRTQEPGSAPQRLHLILLPEQGASIRAETTVRFFSAVATRRRLETLRRRIPALRRRIDRLRAAGQDVAYPRVTLTVLENFTGYAQEDLAREPRRALRQVEEMEGMAVRLLRELEAAERGRRLPSIPVRLTAEHPAIENGVFVAKMRQAGQKNPRKGPVYFHGYGHFGQVRADIEKFPAYGVNLIQIEFGPNSVFPTPDQTADGAIRETLAVLDRAQRAGVMVNLLISPHYFPAWALDRWPHLRKRRSGFIQYCIHAPESQELLRRFLRVAIPPLKDHPALHSVCLSNEPVNTEEPCAFAARDWHAWLPRRHGDIGTLNRRWNTRFVTFEEIPLPDPFSDRSPRPAWMDYIRFNQEVFAGWHRMLADEIHALAPSLPVHAKAMTWTMLNDGDIVYGVDPYLFGSFSQINGNDAVNFYSHGPGEFAQGWTQNAMGHDLQRSALNAPIFNSENHLIPDRDTRLVPASHIRAALWQAALHGQGATTIWVWERTYDPKSDFAGSIMHRPACAEAVGRVNLDMNRVAEEMAALQRAPADLLLLHSLTASVWDGGRYTDCLGKLYTALSFTGLKIGFVTERQLEESIVFGRRPIFVPNIGHLSERAFASLRRYPGPILFVGEGPLLSHDEYNAPRPTALQGETIPFRYGQTSGQALYKILAPKLAEWRLRPRVEVREEGGDLPWGVEWRAASTPQGMVVNLCNYRQKPVLLRLTRNGKPLDAVDALTGEPITGRLRLAPLEIRLLRLHGSGW